MAATDTSRRPKKFLNTGNKESKSMKQKNTLVHKTIATIALVGLGCIAVYALDIGAHCVTTVTTSGGKCPDPCQFQNCDKITITTQGCVNGGFSVCSSLWCSGSTTNKVKGECAPPPTNCDCEPPI